MAGYHPPRKAVGAVLTLQQWRYYDVDARR
jgi:hypothetical protein